MAMPAVQVAGVFDLGCDGHNKSCHNYDRRVKQVVDLKTT